MPTPTPGAVSAPTKGEFANAMRIRDEVAERLAKPSPGGYGRSERLPKSQARVLAERLIDLGYIDLDAVHARIVDGDPDDDDLYLEGGEE